MKKILLLSGGIDSTVAAHLLKKQGVDVHCLSLRTTTNKDNYHEVANAQSVASKLGFAHSVINMDFLREVHRDRFTVVAVGGQLGGCTKAPQRSFTLCVEMMHLIAIAIAGESNATSVVWALNKDDMADFNASEQDEYVSLLRRLSVLRTERDIQIETPLIGHTKIEVIKLGIELGADISKTVSCVQGIPACGECKQCHNVTQALTSAGVLTA
jgi:7-cyano-7-deazaguanine synthase